MRNSILALILPSVSSMALISTTGLAAEEVDTSEPQLQEITITAQRTSENLQKAAVAVDVVSAQALRNAQVSQASELENLVPVLQTASLGGTNTAFYLRGVGTLTANPYTDAAIAFNLDGVYIGKPNATTGYFYDLARVEVLKGPQGTLYGRNATGGAINVIPETPHFGETSGEVSVAGGNFGTIDVSGALNLAVTDNSALRVAAIYSKHDGYNSDGTNDLNARAVRAQYLIKPIDDLTIRVSADYFERLGEGYSSSIAAATILNPFTNTYAFVPSGLAPNVGANDPRSGAVLSGIFNPTAGTNQVPLDHYPSLDGRIWGVQTEINWHTPYGDLTVLPAYRRGKLNDVTEGGAFLVGDQETQQQESVEARFSGKSGRIGYLVGAYYFDDRASVNYDVNQQAIGVFQVFDEETKSVAGFGRLSFDLTDSLRLVAGARYTKDRKYIDGSNTVLIDACTSPTGACPGAPLIPFTTTLVDAVSSLGLINVAPNIYIQPTPAAANSIFITQPSLKNDSLSVGKGTYRAAVEYDVTENSLAYASFETGFRSGGFSFAAIKPSYGPESIKAYTIGSKNRFFDNKLQVNVEGFIWKYADQQVSHSGVDASGTTQFFVENIGKSTNKGGEIEAQYLLPTDTLLAVDAQYLDAKYDSFVYNTPATVNPVLSTPAAPVYVPLLSGCRSIGPTAGLWRVDCSGLQAQESPTVTLQLGLQQTVHLGDNRVVAGASTRYQTASWVGFERIPYEQRPSYWRSSADLSFITAKDRYTVTAFVNNIEDRRVIQQATYAGPMSIIGVSRSDPRTFGVRFTAKFQ